MVTRRQVIFGFALVLAAAPLVWLTTDASAGDKLLRWTSSASNKTSMHELPPGLPRRTYSTFVFGDTTV